MRFLPGGQMLRLVGISFFAAPNSNSGCVMNGFDHACSATLLAFALSFCLSSLSGSWEAIDVGTSGMVEFVTRSSFMPVASSSAKGCEGTVGKAFASFTMRSNSSSTSSSSSFDICPARASLISYFQRRRSVLFLLIAGTV